MTPPLPCSQCGHATGPGAVFCGECGHRLDTAAALDPLLGRRMDGRYVVQAKLGEGAMGAVYRAQDTRLPRQVALKVLSPELWHHADALRRMTQEAYALARIEHPHVVRVFDVFTDQGALVIAMELVEGGDLGRFAAGRPLAVDTVATLVDGILQGLEAIHAAGLVHRDLKPENVLLSARGVPKITDLGVARDSQARDKTQAGVRLGTPAYMSPEQVQGHAVDARSDVYAMGLLLFELLTAQRLFAGRSEFEAMVARVLRPPDLSPLLALSLPQPLYAVVQRALQRDPAARYPTAAALRAAVADAVQPAAAEPPAPAAAVPLARVAAVSSEDITVVRPALTPPPEADGRAPSPRREGAVAAAAPAPPPQPAQMARALSPRPPAVARPVAPPPLPANRAAAPPPERVPAGAVAEPPPLPTWFVQPAKAKPRDTGAEPRDAGAKPRDTGAEPRDTPPPLPSRPRGR